MEQKLFKWNAFSTLLISTVLVTFLVLGLFNKNLSASDEVEIATLVVHHYFPLPGRDVRMEGRPIALTIIIRGANPGVADIVSRTYPKSQRFIENSKRVIRDSCTYDSDTNLPSLGIEISRMTRISTDIVEVEAGSAMCALGLNGSSFVLKRIDGKWLIEKEIVTYET